MLFLQKSIKFLYLKKLIPSHYKLPPNNTPLKPLHWNLVFRLKYQWIRRDLDYIHWCERKTLHLEEENQSEIVVLLIYNGMWYHSSNSELLIFFI